MKVHPAAELFPLMSESELQELADDIKANGLLNPIAMTTDEELLDGRNRLAACKLAGVEPKFVSANGVDPVAFVVSQNVKRRNLSASQKAIAAAEAWDQIKGKVPFKENDRREHLAGMFGVNEKYVQQARALVERDPVAAGEVRAGALPLQKAYEEYRTRETQAAKQESAMATLRVAHSDLADRATEGALSLEEALSLAADRDRKERERKEHFMLNLVDVLNYTDRPLERIDEILSDYDPALISDNADVSPKRIRASASYLAALAAAIEGGEE